MGRLELRGVNKTFANGIVAASGVDLTVEDGELFVIVGPSGSGKSTLLRMVAGLEDLDSGTIALGGRRIDPLPPRDRELAMVFQDPVLYPHLNVFENIAFGLRARGVAKGEVEGRVRESASMLGLGDCLGRAPGTLSGGQRRRVALARALVIRPGLFLLDEPFSGLDAPLRASTRSDLAELKRAIDATMVLVTHDQAEALALGDRVAVIDRGNVVQVGRPLDVYDRPVSRFVARFIGQPPMNLLPCRVDGEGGERTIRIEGLGTRPLDPTIPAPPGRPLEAGFRPEQVRIRPLDEAATSNGYPAEIHRVEPMGHETVLAVALGPHALAARLPPDAPFRAGDRVTVALDFAAASWFDAEAGARIGD